jgi:hypothetical protein
MKIEERISKIQEYIDEMAKIIPLVPDESRRSDFIAYRGFAMLIKELYELHLPEAVARTPEELKKEKEREETVDWMTRWLQDQSKGLEKP